MFIRIDGKQVEVKKWDTVLSAARRAGIQIPSLCYHPALETAGACRVCIVEVFEKGWSERKQVTACEYKVQPDLEVYTRSESVLKTRRTTIDLLMARAPQNAALQALSKNVEYPQTIYPPVADAGDCVLCLLCTRACEQMGCNAISVSGRGDTRKIEPPYGANPDACIGCGACARICPTGCIALTETPATITIWGKVFERLHCVTCGAPMMSIAYRDYAVANRELPEDYYTQCQECKRKEVTARFAGLSMKVHHG
ncbi:MAG: (2Fe-2S)-binding protein [Deltaproteobacteria bacterium]|nr:(2Fe-2S)-binding protein [Deltaproteobacteria bacterium]